jgi:hypothetical protein
VLRLVGMEHEPQAMVAWRIESPTVGVVLFDVDVGAWGHPIPLHWRAGDWRKPPLDIQLDPRSGRLCGADREAASGYALLGATVACDRAGDLCEIRFGPLAQEDWDDIRLALPIS